MTEQDKTEMLTLIGNSIAMSTMAMKEMMIDMSYQAAVMSAELSTGTSLTTEQCEHVRRNLEQYADDNMPKYIQAAHDSFK